MIPDIGDQIKLKGKTLKGKNTIREHGEDWEIVDIARQGRPYGPKEGTLFVEPIIQKKPNVPEMRWIDPFSDPDFEIVH